MAGFGIEQLTRNAFRILGLNADANQAQIDSAARLLRLSNEGAVIAVGPDDARWLGQMSCTLGNIEDAASRLARPESRVEERIWRFFIVPTDVTLRGGSPGANRVEQIHAAAIIRLYRLLLLGSASQVLDKWGTLLKDITHVAQSREFESLLLRAEDEGQFEMRAEPHEIAAAQAAMPAQVAAALVDYAEDALFKANLPLVGKILALLRSLEYCEEPKRRLLQTLEDHLHRSCGQSRADIDIAWKIMQREPLKQAAQAALNQAKRSLEPLLAELLLHVPAGDGHTADRLKGPLIQLFNHCGKAFDGCYDYMAAETVLKKAVVLAEGTPMRAMLDNRLAVIRPQAAQQRERMQSRIAVPMAGRKQVATRQEPEKSRSRRSLDVLLVLMLLAGMSGGAFIGWLNSSAKNLNDPTVIPQNILQNIRDAPVPMPSTAPAQTLPTTTTIRVEDLNIH